MANVGLGVSNPMYIDTAASVQVGIVKIQSIAWVAKATQCGEVIEAEAMTARANDLLPTWVGACWSVQEINDVAIPDAVSETLG